MPDKPNIVIIMTDQQRADLCRREGYSLDTTPFLDSLAAGGVTFDKAYTSYPACAPARASLLTGRYPSATRVRTNHNLPDTAYQTDVVDVLASRGYKTALCGKNHSHLSERRMDYWFPMSHGGAGGDGDRTDDEKAFDAYLSGLHHMTDMNPTPFPVELQGPYRVVEKATGWIDSLGDEPFFLWLSFAEPHNPFQVPEPYFSMFPPDELPAPAADESALPAKGFPYEWTRRMWDKAQPKFAEQVGRTRSNYHGMLRLIDDQVKRFVEHLDAKGLRDNTIIVFTSDHGDFVGEYGLIRKGPGVSERLTRIPMLFSGPGIGRHDGPHEAHVSIVDVMPTLCEAAGAALPDGVQGRSLWPLLTGQDYPAGEFASAYVEHGYGGLRYDGDDELDPTEEGALNPGCTFDCLNSWTQSGSMRMVRKGDWKLVCDMLGSVELYNLVDDPAETANLAGRPEHAAIQQELTTELLAWTLRAEDPLPYPRRRYVFKRHPRNYRPT